jgi:hypothetical protein
MKAVDAHLADVLDGVRPLSTVTVTLIDALGAVLGPDLRSESDLPVFTNSAMDGYAVGRCDLAGATESNPVTMTVTGDVGARTVAPVAVPGSAVRVMRSAPLPAGAGAMVPVEWTDAGVEVVQISRQPAPSANIRAQGEDVLRGSVVLREGAIIDTAAIAPADSPGASIRRPLWSIDGFIPCSDNAFLTGVDHHRAPANEAHQGHPHLGGQFGSQRRRCRNRCEYRDPGHQSLLCQLEARPSRDHQDRAPQR